MRTAVLRACLAPVAWVALVALLLPDAARAQIFSPGDLSKAHASVDGIRDCVKCHAEGGGHDNGLCIACHKEIGQRLDRGDGYHASVKSRLCAECHLEHRGRQRSIVEWTPSRDAFNHRLTGWPLEGAHKEPDCKTCHEPRRIIDDDVLAAVKKGRESYLGVSTRCVTCHFDEHRGQEGNDCLRCHDQSKFKRAPGFNHNDKKDARFPLAGKHRDVACKECHDTLTDKAPPADFPPRRDDSYLKLKKIPFASCADCHDDFHDGKFGSDCARCHSPSGWRVIKDTAQNTGFHDKHAFKLRGEHNSVACKGCHGPFAGQPARFKGLKFRRCADCHIDSHVGQLAPENGAVSCEKCHTENGFGRVLFDTKMHETTRFPLEGAHQVVACDECHTNDPRVRTKVPPSVKREVARKGLRLLISEARLKMPDVFEQKNGQAEPNRCETCHEDPHRGQFERAVSPEDKRGRKKACVECHSVAATFAEVKFTHDDSRFPLTGKHQEVACGACHASSERKGPLRGAVVYRPLAVDCASCHADVHVGQLAKAGVTDCATCHTTTGFLPGVFDHAAQSSFPLEGRHAQVQCARCHPQVDAEGTRIARYKPIPGGCASCHEDEHQGVFDMYTPSSAKAPGRCDACHAATGWAPAAFAHERTGFELTGKHGVTRCAECHGNDTKRPVPTSCAGCHVDAHAQEFGLMCGSCHTTESFTAPGFLVDAHRRSNFPLVGRHAGLPCDECHVEKRQRTFARAPVDCAGCHAKDAIAASLVTVDHARAPFAGASCRACHAPATFAPASFPQHEACFPISRGIHAPVRCAECHTGLAGASADGDCAGIPVRCAECHAHRAEIEDARHTDVVGYAHKSEKCAGCHRVP